MAVFNEKEEKEIHPGIQKEAVKLITEQGYRISQAARNLGVNVNMLGCDRAIGVGAGSGQVSYWLFIINFIELRVLNANILDFGPEKSLMVTKPLPVVPNEMSLFQCHASRTKAPFIASKRALSVPRYFAAGAGAPPCTFGAGVCCSPVCGLRCLLHCWI